MPKMNGYEVCKVLKKDPATAKIKIVMLTNLCGKLDDHKQNSKVAADEYLSKPFTATVLIDKFEKVMAGA